MDLSAHLSAEGASRQWGELRRLVIKYSGIPGQIGLHGGLPPPSTFPIRTIRMGLQDGTEIEVDPKDVLGSQMQYLIPSVGWEPLRKWVYDHTLSLHRPAGEVEVAVCGGATQGMDALVSLLTERGDAVLVEEYSYSHCLECCLAPRGLEAVPMPIDGEGIIPERLEELLAARRADGSKPFPRVLYTVPTGQNPTGSTAPLARRRAVYELCRRYDILIIEDDPYYYLQWSMGPDGRPGEGVPGLRDLPRGESYLSIDTEGRVARLDTFAKTLSPGLRLAWLTASPALVERVAQVLNAQTLGPCGVMQAMAAAMLAAWGEEGLHTQLATIQATYRDKAAVALAAATQHLTGLATWDPPSAGMFLWLRFTGVRDARDVMDAAAAAGVIFVPGYITHPSSADAAFACPAARVSFSYETHAHIEEGIRRLGQALRSVASNGKAHA